MPWKTCNLMDLRREFVKLALTPGTNRSQLCEQFEISRNTGYRWIRRYHNDGEGALADRSRAPKESPGRTSESMERLVVAVRKRYGWGGRKTRDLLLNMGEERVPAASTMTGIFRRHGLLSEAAEKPGSAPGRFERPAPNELWQMDFKGHVAVGSGERRCHPLTMTDDHSRYGLVIKALAGETGGPVRKVLAQTFRRYGLPQAILCDNGPPWGSSHPGTVTALGVWLLELGVDVLHGRPRHPQTQGKEERFHRTLKKEVLSRRTHWRSLAECQRAFDKFRERYNLVRPHDSLGGQEPVTRYRTSDRRMPERIADMREHYLDDDQTRKVRSMGMTTFQGQTFGVGRGFSGKTIAFRQVGEESWEVLFGWKCLGVVDLSGPKNGKCKLRPLKPRS